MLEAILFDEEVTQIRMSREMGGKPVYWVAAYLVDGLLIDTGCSYTAHELAAFLDNRPVHQVINTHFHEDHIGGNHLLQKKFGVRIYAPADSVPLIAREAKLFPYQETAWGYPEPTEVTPLPAIIRTNHHQFSVIDTPGHSRGHVSLVEMDRGWCFSGDIFAREKMKFIRPEEDMGETVASLKILIALSTDRLVLLTSLGRIVEEGREAIGSCIRHIEALSLCACKLQKEGADVAEIIRRMFGGEHGFAQITNGQYTTENLIRSLLMMGAGKGDHLTL
jgi:glyoxylase-like metal-dependent hydrolase (beta-lactamase superfamily II)